MNYEEAIAFLQSTRVLGMELGLHAVSALLDAMDNPHKKLKFVHVAGTNGKGSTIAFLSSILMCSGYKTGTFNSPYIERFTEQIRINGTEIEKDQLARLTAFAKSKIQRLLERGEPHPTEFEITAAIAFQYFYEQGCDVVVLEVGLGGRLDATNVIDTPDLGVITAISYDHMNILGNTIEEIATEKAGIIKPGEDVAAYSPAPAVKQVLRNACTEKHAKLHIADFSHIQNCTQSIHGQTFDFDRYKTLQIALLGEHQVKNAALAVLSAEVLQGKGYRITEASIRRGLLHARWPGRLEVLQTNPVFLIDGAHNMDGVTALTHALDSLFHQKNRTFIVGVMRDKDYPSMLAQILPGCERVFTVTPNNNRALPAADLATEAAKYCKNVHVCNTVPEAVRNSLAGASSEDVICAFGSLYYIGEVRNTFSL